MALVCREEGGTCPVRPLDRGLRRSVAVPEERCDELSVWVAAEDRPENALRPSEVAQRVADDDDRRIFARGRHSREAYTCAAVSSAGTKLAQRLVLRASSGRLRPVCSALAELLVRRLARELTAGEAGASAYVRGGFGSGDVVLGLSDVDMVVVVREEKRGQRHAYLRVRDNYERLCRRLPIVRRIVAHFFVFEETDLHQAAESPAQTYGLDPGGQPRLDRAAYLGSSPLGDELGLMERPGLYGATADWRLVHGAEWRPRATVRTSQDERLVAWLELQSWWRWAFDAVCEPDRPHVGYLCTKLVSEPCRIWLWLARRERYDRRRDALRRAARLLPEEREPIERTLAAYDELRHGRRPPLDDSLAALVRLSTLVAEELAAQVEPGGVLEVRLEGNGVQPGSAFAGSSPDLLPLVDWRACVLPSLLDEAFALVDGDLSDPGSVASIAARPGPHGALRSGPLLVFPTTQLWHRGLLRSIQCPVTDPVSFALLDGRDRALFPRVAGWSAPDLARRAVAELRAWLHTGSPRHRSTRLWLEPPPSPEEPSARTVSMLLSCARAALFLESLEDGEPALQTTAAAIAAALGRRGDEALATAYAAKRAYRRALLEGAPPAPSDVDRLRRLVATLPQMSRDRARHAAA
jgi:hypothetical protein